MKTLPTDRPWDRGNEFLGGSLFSTRFWTVEVSYRQHTAGCFIIFCNRPCQFFSELTPEEMSDLPLVMKRIEGALLRHPDLKPDWFNYLQLGNTVKHLHLHGIPRYTGERNFIDRVWSDKNLGKPPQWTFDNCKKNVVETIRKELVPYLL